ncbi:MULTISPECIES: hypothetical protein [unclassified Frondihabitans]|uniref:hypothetical protein n=1 Tax=unclassified Frondihabitans TaxID=2626248 RepID=UPI000F4F0958|nr:MULTISPECIES: hypothetical protein [unclassified Frondihabitans]RPE75209.1 hypothetical protein EDF37_2813 [Frondihabitans sp. PhB153]RPF04451.1 hypothetical protein EDF39_2881 [Frondihabitans sp. PhB161]
MTPAERYMKTAQAVVDLLPTGQSTETADPEAMRIAVNSFSFAASDVTNLILDTPGPNTPAQLDALTSLVAQEQWIYQWQRGDAREVLTYGPPLMKRIERLVRRA